MAGAGENLHHVQTFWGGACEPGIVKLFCGKGQEETA